VRALDHFEYMPVAVKLAGRRSELHGPHPSGGQVALGPDNPAGIVLAVERRLALGIGEGVEDFFGRGVDQSCELDVEPHRRSALACLT